MCPFDRFRTLFDEINAIRGARMISLLIAVAGAAPGAAPTRLRADGSDWLSFPRFALPHMARPLFTWAPGTQTAFTLELSDAAGHLVWASGKQLSTEPSVNYPPSAPALQPGTYHWRVATYSDPSSAPSPFASAALHVAIPPADWSMAAWLGGDAVNVYTASFQTGPKSSLASVVLYVCGLGYSSVRFNGHDLNVLTTAPWTNNAIVNGFSSLDLTPWLADGGNANHVIVSLGYGWRDTNVFTVRDADSKDHPAVHANAHHGVPIPHRYGTPTRRTTLPCMQTLITASRFPTGTRRRLEGSHGCCRAHAASQGHCDVQRRLDECADVHRRRNVACGSGPYDGRLGL